MSGSDTGLYFSVEVPATNTMDFLRLGDPDNAEESALPDKPSSSGTSGTSPFSAGILLYTTGVYELVAPTFTSWSGDSLSVIRNGGEVVSASYTLPSQPFTTTFQMAAQLNATIGNVSNFVTGNELNYWLGNSASTGLGGLLWSNVGLTQNVFGGQIVNVINSAIDVQGIGEAKLQTGFELVASGDIDLLISPAANASASALMGKYQKWAAIVGAAVPLAGTAINDVQTSVAGALTSNSEKMRDVMIASFSELSAMTAAVVVLQAAVALAGLKAKAAAAAAIGASAASIEMSSAGITLTVGASRMVLTDSGAYFDTFEIGWQGLQLQHTATAVQFDPG
jgi:hypothetical protein